MIKIIALGKIKEQYLNDLINDYLKRINKYHKTEIIELKDENDLDKENKALLKHYNPKDYTIVCDLNGKSFTSEEFSSLMNEKFILYSNITFIIGSSEGLHSEIKSKANLLLKFSNFTFPHGLFRGILLEQLYRSFKILNNMIKLKKD